MQRSRIIKILKVSLAFAVLSNIAFWFYSRNMKAEWRNVPPVPSKISAVAPALGDAQFASRLISMMIQNLGSTGGRITPVKDYDFEKLGDWLILNYELDPYSDITPYMAGYYFGASQDPTKIRAIFEYLRVA